MKTEPELYYINKVCLLAQYSFFSAPNFGILFTIVVLQHALEYHQNHALKLFSEPIPLYQNFFYHYEDNRN